MIDGQPLVSVIIPTHNRSALLKRAIESVLGQSYRHFEIIVVDDGSDDDTPQILEMLKARDSRIATLRHTQSRGGNAARNSGVKAARGEFITGLDDDDEFYPHRIEKLLEAYDDRYAFITAGETVIGSSGRARYWRKRPLITRERILLQNEVGNQALMRRQRLVDVGMYDEGLTACQDYDLWIRLIDRYGSAKTVDVALQIKHDEHTHLKVSAGRDAFSGYWSTFRKHRDKLSVRQRKARIFHLYRIRKKPLSLKRALMLGVDAFPAAILKYYLKRRLRR